MIARWRSWPWLKEATAPMLIALRRLALLAAPAVAQETTGSIEGVVKDPNGAVLPGATADDANAFALDVLEAFTRPLLGGATPTVLTISVGIAEHFADHDLAHVIQRADEKLYQAKRSGRNLVVL